MKETIKTIVIFLLCGLIVVLVSELWLDPFNNNQLNLIKDEPYQIEDVSYLVDVKAINYGFGFGQIATLFFDKEENFKRLKPQFSVALTEINQAQPISEKEYYALRKSKYVEFVLSSDIKVEQLILLLSNQDVSFKSKVNKIDKIMISSSDKASLYLHGGNEYYLLKTPKLEWDIDQLINNIDTERAVIYTSLKERFSIDDKIQSNNDYLLMPSSKIENFEAIQVNLEISAQQAEAVHSLATKVFGSRINFVQDVFDINGARIMLYGYGDRALKITPSGLVEFSQKINKETALKKNLLRDLKTALASAERLNIRPQRLLLQSIKEVSEEDNDGYRFTFGYRINNFQVVNASGLAGVEVTILNGQLHTLSKNIKRYIMMKPQNITENDDPLYSILNKKDNLDILKADYKNMHPNFLDDADAYIEIFLSISDFDIGYLDHFKKISQGDNDSAPIILTPVYMLTLGKYKYYFNVERHTLVYKEELL